MQLRNLFAAAALGLSLIAWALWPAPYPALGQELPMFDAPCAGEILLARADTDPDFEEAVVLVCSKGEDGAIGLMLGSESRENFHQALRVDSPQSVLRGGPMGRAQLVVLYQDGPQLRWTTQQIQAPFPQPGWARLARVNTRSIKGAFRGYVGWGPGQLDQEIEADLWMSTRVSAMEILRSPPRGRVASRWRASQERLRERDATAAANNNAGHPEGAPPPDGPPPEGAPKGPPDGVPIGPPPDGAPNGLPPGTAQPPGSP